MSMGPSPKVRSILELSLGLAEAVVLSGQLKLSHVETKLRMEVGGATRQCLRLGGCGHRCCILVPCVSNCIWIVVLATASLSTIQSNIDHRVRVEFLW